MDFEVSSKVTCFFGSYLHAHHGVMVHISLVVLDFILCSGKLKNEQGKGRPELPVAQSRLPPPQYARFSFHTVTATRVPDSGTIPGQMFRIAPDFAFLFSI